MHNSLWGVALLIHSSVQHKAIDLNKGFDAVGLEITSKITFHIISCFISPNKQFTSNNLDNMFRISSTPTLITGDFNSWHKSWGSLANSRKGNTLHNFINNSNFILLNDKTPTHLSTFGSMTNIDLSFCSPELSIHSKWKVASDPHGSDHLPICIAMFHQEKTDKLFNKPKFKTDLADWPDFQKHCSLLTQSIPVSSNVNKEAANVRKIVINAANKSIPQMKEYRGPKYVPWWKKDLEQLKRNKVKAWQDFKRNINLKNILNYKKANAKLKQNIKKAKKDSQNKFTSTINPLTPIGSVWTNIRRFTGYKVSHQIHCLISNTNSTPLVNKTDIANELELQWSKMSADVNVFEKKKYCCECIPKLQSLPVSHRH